MEITKEALDKHYLRKQEWFEEFNLKYSQMLRFLQPIPIPPQMKMNGFARMDEFFMWIREGINHIQMEMPPQEPTPPPANPQTPPETPPANDTETAV